MSIKKGFTVTRARAKTNKKFKNINRDSAQEPSFHTMRRSQREVYKKYRNRKYMIVRQPPGAGKSTTIKFVFSDELSKNKNLKIIIAIPQTIAGSSFENEILQYDNGEKTEWVIPPDNNLSRKWEEKVCKITSFLKNKKFVEGVGERILICTHAGLINAMKKVKIKDIKNTVFVIDEAHHIQAPSNAIEEMEEYVVNRLGSMVKKIIDNNDGTNRIWLTTATFFRGDGVEILSEEYMKQFSSYFLPLDEHFEDMEFLESYSYDFVPYCMDFPGAEVEKLLKNKKRQIKTIFYVPGAGRKWAGKNKVENVERLKKSILKVWKNANILDLVTEAGREQRKIKLMDNKYNSNIDVVIAVNLLDEGTDWPEAEQVIDLAPSNSLRIANQRFGRLLRDRPCKKHIHYYVFFQNNIDFKDTENIRKKLSEGYAALSASFMLEESINPVKLQVKTKKKEVDKEKNTEKAKTKSYFIETVKEPDKRQEIKSEIYEELVALRLKSDKNGVKITKEDYIECIKKTLRKYRVRRNIDNIVSEIQIELVRRFIPSFINIDVSVYDLVKNGFDKITWDKITDKFIAFFASVKGNKETLKEIKAYYTDRRKTLEEWVAIAEIDALANINGELEELVA